MRESLLRYEPREAKILRRPAECWLLKTNKKTLKKMRTIKFYITILVAAVSMVAAVAADKSSKIVLERTSYDFGTIRESDGPVSVEFKFSNEGESPLVILSARASCGCTRPEYPKRPVAVGQSGTIKVTFDPNGRPGEFIKDVTVKTNDKKSKRINLRLTGVVIPK